jgi:hypothetical protein
VCLNGTSKRIRKRLSARSSIAPKEHESAWVLLHQGEAECGS